MGRNYVKSAIGVTAVMTIGYLLSFVKEATVANFFGVSLDVDAYTIAITIPVTLFAMVSASIQSIIIPLYSNNLINDGEESANKNISTLITIISCITFCFIILCELLADGLVYVFAPGFSEESHNLASMLLKLTAPTIMFSVLEKVFVGMLNVRGKYSLPSLSILFLNSGIIISILYLHAHFGIASACVGQIVGSVLSFLFVLYLSRNFFHYEYCFSFQNPFVKKALKQSLPIIWSVSLAEISALVNRIVASFLLVGSISALGYASKLNSVMLQFFTVAISTIIFPLYAESSAKKDMRQLNSRVNVTLTIYSFFLLPLMVGIFCFKEELVEVAFGRGAFDQEAIEITKTLLGIYSIGLLFFALRENITKVFYSLQDTKTPAKNATMAVFTTIFFNLTLPVFLGVNGLALASTSVAIIFSITLIYKLCRLHREISLSIYYNNLPRIVLSAVIMGIGLQIFKYYIGEQNSFLSLIAGTCAGLTLYFCSNLIFRTPILKTCFKTICRKN